jgi:hypothetical protein
LVLSRSGRIRVAHRDQTTIAILSGSSVVGRVLELLLRGVGYEVRLLEVPDGLAEVGDPLEGVDILLLGRGLDDDRREGFLRAMATDLGTASIPVLSLSPSPRGAMFREDRLVPWPCRVEDLAREIEAALPWAAVDQA